MIRYVEHPGRRRAIRAGRRNLMWGVAFLVAALSVFGIALYVGGARAVLPPAFFLACFTALWVLTRMKVFSQRNGVFFAISVVVLLGASAALMEQAWVYLVQHPISTSAVPNVSLAPPSSSVPVQAPEFPLLTESLKIERAENSLPRVRASRDLNVNIGGKTYAVRKGEIFQLADEKNGEFVIAAGEFLARVPVNAMDQLAPELAHNSDPKAASDDGKGALEKAASAGITKRAQAEAVRRFPGLGKSGSTENKTFVDAYNDLKRSKSDLLDDPEWPVNLAEILARRFGWEEAGVIDADAPAVVEPSIAPGTKMLSEPEEPANARPDRAVPTEKPDRVPALVPAPKSAKPATPAKSPNSAPVEDPLPTGDPDIPPPPRGPSP
jgi:hypothetical protein